MAENISAIGTSSEPTAQELQQWYSANKRNIENYAKSKNAVYTLRDVTKAQCRRIQCIDKETLKEYFDNVGGHERDFRNISRYLYYRSNIYYRIINWYANMFDLRCRKVIPKYDLTREPNQAKMLKNFNRTLDLLDRMNLQGNMNEVLINVFAFDVCYALVYLDDTGMFFYILDPDECVIDGRYSTGDLSFSVDMSKWKGSQRQRIIEFLGEPLKSMWDEYQRTGHRFVHVPDDRGACFKFRMDTWDSVIPPFITTLLQTAGLEDLVDIQSEADQLDIYKLLYLPMDVLQGTKSSDDFEISPDLAHKYFERLVETAVPDGVAAAMVPGKELKVVDFQKSVDSETTSVEKASNQILQTAGGGAVINASKITTIAGFECWKMAETEYAVSSLIPQINGFANRMLMSKLGTNACKVEHFELSVYTKDSFAEKLMKSAQYSYPNRLAYNTCLGISEKDTLAMLFFENEVLKLPEKMRFPLASSFTASDGYTNEVGQGAPTKDVGDLTDSGAASRNQ